MKLHGAIFDELLFFALKNVQGALGSVVGWLGHFATCRNVTGWRPDKVVAFFLFT
jgi:hypothetical protein